MLLNSYLNLVDLLAQQNMIKVTTYDYLNEPKCVNLSHILTLYVVTVFLFLLCKHTYLLASRLTHNHVIIYWHHTTLVIWHEVILLCSGIK